VQEARDRGYHVEPQEMVVEDEDTGAPLIRFDDRTVIVDFPMTHGDDVRTEESMTAIDQMETVRRLQASWSDNAGEQKLSPLPCSFLTSHTQCLSRSSTSCASWGRSESTCGRAGRPGSRRSHSC